MPSNYPWKWRSFALALLLCFSATDELRAQASPYAVQRGLSIGLEYAHTSPFEVELSAPYASPDTLTSADGIGLVIGYGIRPWVAFWAETFASLVGESDPSAVTDIAGGVELRGHWLRRVIPTASAGIGRTWAPTAGGIQFNYVAAAGGVNVHISRRFAVRGSLHHLVPIGSATSTSSSSTPPAVSVEESRQQVRFGVRYHLGGRD